MTDARDYRDTVFLPKTDFPMKAGLPAKEPGILARWQEMGLYERLREQRRGREKFILHDGPPYANGDMHIGHAMQRILKDMVVRTQTLLGKDAPFVPGWDCHGLPIEWKVEEEYRKKKRNKDEIPVEEFRAECRAYAQHWVNTQREQIKRLGALGDWDHPYLTMDFEAEATIVAELMKFAESGQLYRGAKPVMWSPVEKTALAEAEVEYEDIVSTQIDVAFEIVESPIPELVGAHAVIWTTTPWTIPVNQALAYGPEIEYVLLQLRKTHFVQTSDPGDPRTLRDTSQDKAVLVASSLVDDFAKRLNPPQIIANWIVHNTGKLFRGADLAGTIARHPMASRLPSPPSGGEGPGERGESASAQAFDVQTPPSPFAADAALPSPPEGGEGYLAEFFNRPRPFLPGDFVTTDAGTGLVHMSPDHGEDDFLLCKAHGIDPVFAVEADGKYREDWAWLGGEGSVINAKFNAPDGPICSDLREAGGLLAASADFQHSYPHSWRSKAKVIYRCTPQWFVPMDRALDVSASLDGRASSALGMSDEETSASTAHPERRRGTGSSEAESGNTLRQTAMRAIAATRFVPEKGRNRIGSMVEGRPDWVLSRQRAWGVPITLFVDRKTGHYLVDEAVNSRIVSAVRKQGVDAWNDEAAQKLLGHAYRAEDYERVTDILDVWFDSGCTHAFVLESGKWPDLQSPADLYLEGSDQHRGWFQSSLLESCGTRGRAPYKAVLTHGFTMDAKGMKMSKSLGNTINPLDLMRDYGADILRLWALSVDFTEDHRIGKEILSGVADQYRKLRNSFRYLLGALEGFSEDERVGVAEMPELERYVLHLLADMDAKLKQAVKDFDFNTYVRLISDFANNDLSAFFFDIRKDCLYCDAPTSPKRRAYRTVLDTLFHALVRYAAPVLVFTAEEVWQTRYPDEGSVHFSDWPDFNTLLRHPGEGRGPDGPDVEGPDPGLRRDDELGAKWTRLRQARNSVNMAIEPFRREKTLGTSLEASLCLQPASKADHKYFDNCDLTELFISGTVTLDWSRATNMGVVVVGEQQVVIHPPPFVTVTPTTNHKCGRCWRHLPEVTKDGALCARCDEVVNG